MSETRLYRRKFEPIVGMGGLVMLRNSDGFITDGNDCPVYEITDVSSQMGLGPRGTTVIWSHTDAPQASYAVDKQCIVGSQLGVDIPAGGPLPTLVPDFLTLQKGQFGQWRFLMREVPDSDDNQLNTGLVIDDFDLVVSIPQAYQGGGTQRIIGVMNNKFQGQLASDAVTDPLQGNNFAAPSVGYVSDPFDLAYRSERFSYGGVDTGTGSVNLKNNGAIATTQGAIGLNVGLFLYNITPVHAGGNARKVRRLGYDIVIPGDVDLREIALIPVQGQMSPKYS